MHQETIRFPTSAPEDVVDITSEPGTTLTFGEDPFLWTELDAAAGEYVVGFIVEDLDGGAVESYTQVTVE